MHSRLKKSGGVLVAGLVVASAAALAQEEGALGIKLGAGNRLLLSLESDLAYYSNYYFQEDDEDSALGLLVKPGATFNADRGNFKYQIAGSAEAGAWDLDGDEDDYLDTLLKGGFQWQPLTRHGLKGGAYWAADHDPFGTRRTETSPFVNTDLDEWTQYGANLVYRFGAPTAKINLEGEVNALDREYDTNRATTQFLDYDYKGVRGTVFYNLSPKTALVAEVITGEVEYDEAASATLRDADVTRYRVGARWQATAKTEGDVRVGRLERDFDDDAQKDFKGTDWQVGATWSPRVRDAIRVTGGREAEESYNAANFIDTQYIGVVWWHDWTSMLKSSAGYSYSDQDFEGIDRRDEVQKLALGVEYQAAPRWSVFGQVAAEERDSDAALRDYDNTSVVTGIRLVY